MNREFCCTGTVVHEGALLNARETALPDLELEEMVVLYKMMGDKSRLRILWALRQGEMCVCDLAALLGITKSAVSHHLKALRLAKLAGSRRDGKVVYYSLRDEHVAALIDLALIHIREKEETR